MPVSRRVPILAAGVTSAVVLAGLSAGAQSYFHAPAGGPNIYRSWGSSPAGFYGVPAGATYASPWSPSYAGPSLQSTGYPSFGTMAPPYGTVPYGAGTYGNPRGRLTYDVYTPYGKMEHTYRFRRNGTVGFDIDD